MRIEVELSGDDDATAELADRLHDWIEAAWPHARIRVDYGCPLDACAISGDEKTPCQPWAVSQILARITMAREELAAVA